MSKKRIAKLRAKLKAAEERADFFYGELLKLDPTYLFRAYAEFQVPNPRSSVLITNLQPPAPEVEK